VSVARGERHEAAERSRQRDHPHETVIVAFLGISRRERRVISRVKGVDVQIVEPGVYQGDRILNF
jgi:hypothetical protein